MGCGHASEERTGNLARVGARAGSVCRGPSGPGPVGTGGPSPLSNGGLGTRPRFTRPWGAGLALPSCQGPSSRPGVPGAAAGVGGAGRGDAMRQGPGRWKAAPCSRRLSDGALPSSALISM